MKKQQVLIVSVLICFATVIFPFDLSAFSTFWPVDFLVYQKDTLPIHSEKGELIPNSNELSNLLGGRNRSDGTKCYSPIRTYWEVQGKTLYLVKVSSDCSNEQQVRNGLTKIFGARYQHGKVKADWFSGTIFALKGPIIPINWAPYPVFENELEYIFSEGRQQKVVAHDNSKSKDSPYARETRKLTDFIYTNIRWDEMPFPSGQQTKVFVRFSANKLGRIDSLTVLKGINPMLNREAVRVIKKIPEWYVIYRHGKHDRQIFNYPIDFSDETRRKYAPGSGRRNGVGHP